MSKIIRGLIFLLLIIILPVNVLAVFLLDIETGAVYTGYNDVRIPGDSGTGLSLSDDLDADPVWFYRISPGYIFDDRHYFGVLLAPLTVKSSGTLDRDIIFAGKAFSQGERVDAVFMFNSYRLTYRYNGFKAGNFTGGIGLTGKIRHASIKIESNTQESEKKNIGFVPLINFFFSWEFSSPFGLLIEGDALAAPQGRAEDVLFAFTWDINDKVKAKAGYRILEGGADNDEVYTFSMFHYAAAGVTVQY